MKNNIKKLVKTLLGIAVLIFGVTFLSFSLMYLAPGDPAESILRAGGSMPSQEDILEKRAEMGLDRPLLEQYGSWLEDFLHGDLGVSMIDGKDVTSQLLEGLSNSMLLSAICLIAGTAVAFPLGVYSAVKKDKAFDKITSFIVFLRLSTPSFLLGLLLLYIFAYKLKLVSVVGGSAGMAGIVLPVVTLGTAICVRMLRQIRAAVIQELKDDGTFEQIANSYIGDSAGENYYESPEDVDRSNGTLVMATNAEFPPYEYYEGEDIVGLDADFAQAIADKLGMDLKIEDMAFDSIIPAVTSGKADFGAAGMTVTEEREQQVLFSDTYYTARQVIIVKE